MKVEFMYILGAVLRTIEAPPLIFTNQFIEHTARVVNGLFHVTVLKGLVDRIDIDASEQCIHYARERNINLSKR
jgi:hypothetical protein